jgi:hypothetical protein
MPLPETSPLETALARITGETTGNPPTKLIDYAAPLTSTPPIPTQDVTLGAEQPVAAAKPEDPWLAEMRAQTAQIMAQNATFGQPAAPPTIDVTVIRNAMAKAGVGQQAIDEHIANVLSHGATPTYTGQVAKVTTQKY